MRHNTVCIYCKGHTATFWVKSAEGYALYRCNDMKRKNPCGRVFEAPHPQPMREMR